MAGVGATQRIFVGIPSYRDPECRWTIRDIFERAMRPERVFVGLCSQLIPEEDSDDLEFVSRPEQCRRVVVDAREARGLGWARGQAQALWRGEEYSLQIDSHMRFVRDWDEKLLQMLALCPSPNAALSSYAPTYEPPNERGTPAVTTMRPRAFPTNDAGRLLEIRPFGTPEHDAPAIPQQNAFIGGHLLFGPSEMFAEVPADPFIYVGFEEVTLAARLWTHGWNVYAPNRVVAYHRYTRDGRPMHWHDHRQWARARQLSRRRAAHLLGMEACDDQAALIEIQRYGLGTRRTLASFEAFAGLDLRSRTIDGRSTEEIAAEGKRRPSQAALPRGAAQADSRASLAYLLCTSPRTGSALLAEALTGTGRAGAPAEYFDPRKASTEYWLDRFDIREINEFAEKIIARTMTSNDVFGVKLHWPQYESLRKSLGRSDLGAFSESSDTEIQELLITRFKSVKYLWLYRKNKVLQGISYYRAACTGRWQIRNGERSLSKMDTVEPEFNFDDIDYHVKLCQIFDLKWQQIFRAANVNPLVLLYEDFVAHYRSTIEGVLDFLGVPTKGVTIAAPAFARQADDISLEWEARYRTVVAANAGGARAASGAKSAPPRDIPLPPIPRMPPERAASIATAMPATAGDEYQKKQASPRVPTRISRTYFICAGPRTGSTMLCDALSSTGLMGHPDAYFPTLVPAYRYLSTRFGASNGAGYVDGVVDAATTPNGICGIKLFWSQTELLRARLTEALDGNAAGPRPLPLEESIRQRFGPPRYIWLRRQNKVAQGISLYRASSTGVWQSVKGRDDQNIEPDKRLEFDFAKIHQCVRAVEDNDFRWDHYFRTNRIAPLVVIYEQLVEDSRSTVQGIMQYLGMSHEGVVIAPPVLERQADDRSLEWEQRYTETRAERGT